MLARMLIDNMQSRILVGITMFLGTMVLVGWLAINEGGRMQAFERKYEARSVERGAALFTANCTGCHGADGRGLTGIAPSLNSPYLFGYDYLGVIDTEVSVLQVECYIPETPTEGACTKEGVSPERSTEIAARLTELATQRTAVITQLQSAVDKGYDPEKPSRLTNLGWGGTLDNFIYTTLVHGRPTSISYWPQPMVAWGQTAGGPLRTDQLRDITAYIMNYNREWTVEDLLAVNQFPIRPVDPSTVTAGVPIEVVGTDVAALFARFDSGEVTGDPQAGQTLYNGVLGCAGCHVAGAGVVAPPLEGTWSDVQENRLNLDQFAGYTGEHYLIESIINPGAYTVPGYAGQMPANYGDRLTFQDLVDLVAFLKSQDQPTTLAQ